MIIPLVDDFALSVIKMQNYVSCKVMMTCDAYGDFLESKDYSESKQHTLFDPGINYFFKDEFKAYSEKQLFKYIMSIKSWFYTQKSILNNLN